MIMKGKLKYLKLFEGLSPDEIPYSDVLGNGKMSIIIPEDVTELPEVYNELTDEVTWTLIINSNQSLTEVNWFNNLTRVGGHLSIDNNKSLTSVTGFNNLTWVGGYLSIKNNKFLTEVTGFDNLTQVGGYLEIESNKSLIEVTGFNNLTKVIGGLVIKDNQSLTSVTGFEKLTEIGTSLSIKNNKYLTSVIGFNNLTKIGTNLWIRRNPKLVAMSIPGNLVRSVDYSKYYGIYYDIYDDLNLRFTSPPEFINSPVVIDDLVEKLNPSYHGKQVGIQIWENLKEWATRETIDTIIAKLTPEQLNILPEEFYHLYHPDYKSTSGRDVAKLNTGQIYGIF